MNGNKSLRMMEIESEFDKYHRRKWLDMEHTYTHSGDKKE